MKNLAPALFLLLCCSISPFAQSPSKPKESWQNERIKVTFRNISVKPAISTLGTQMGLNVVFDDTIEEDKLDIELTDVTVDQAMKTILEEKKLQARIIKDKKIIVFPDNEANRKKYEQYELWPAKSDGNK